MRSSKLMTLSIAVAIGLSIFTYTLINSFKTKSSSAQVITTSSTSCQSNDQFLCQALSLMNEENFADKVTSGTITSFDGSTKVVRTWQKDSNENYVYTTNSNGQEENRVIHQQGRQYVKDTKTNKWNVESNASNAQSSPIVEQLGLDEDLSQFFQDNSLSKNYTYQNLGQQPCGDSTCIEYLAINKLSTDTTKEYLYFDVNTYQLKKYTLEKPEYQSEWEFNYAPQPTIEAPLGEQ